MSTTTGSAQKQVVDPGEVAAVQNYWTLSITDLDHIIDRLEARARILAETGGETREMGHELREASAAIRSVRDRMLSENYDANRRGLGVTEARRGT